jgi:hypothetical protein
MNKSSRDDKRAAFSTDMCNSKKETSFTETKFDSANQATCIVKADPEQQVSSPKKVARKKVAQKKVVDKKSMYGSISACFTCLADAWTGFNYLSINCGIEWKNDC